jgi:hypothetical protein
MLKVIRTKLNVFICRKNEENKGRKECAKQQRRKNGE